MLRSVMVVTRPWQDAFDLRDRHDWQVPTKQQKQREEQAEAAGKHADVDPRW